MNWIYMLIAVLLIPLMMIGIGAFFAKKIPAKINRIYGYRTDISMKNKDTWFLLTNIVEKSGDTSD